MIEVLKGSKDGTFVESSQQSLQIDTAYLGREQKFVEDTSTSLVGHVKQFREHLEEMLTGFKTFEAEWIKKINDWLIKVGEMEEHRSTMSGRLFDFSHNI